MTENALSMRFPVGEQSLATKRLDFARSQNVKPIHMLAATWLESHTASWRAVR